METEAVLVLPTTSELACHQHCPLTGLLKCLPKFNELVELYYRCKLCPFVQQVHQGQDALLRHVQRCHATYYQAAPHHVINSPDNTCTARYTATPLQSVQDDIYEEETAPPVCRATLVTSHQEPTNPHEPCVPIASLLHETMSEAENIAISDSLIMTSQGLNPATASTQDKIHHPISHDSKSIIMASQELETVTATSQDKIHPTAHGSKSEHCETQVTVLTSLHTSTLTTLSDSQPMATSQLTANSKRRKIQPSACNMVAISGGKQVSASDKRVDPLSVEMTLAPCSEDPCCYGVQLPHVHCLSCQAAVKENDVNAHTYCHVPLHARPVHDVNVKQVLIAGRMCAEESCPMSAQISKSTSALRHVHCVHCPGTAFSLGVVFQQHLKKEHPSNYATCCLYCAEELTSEQCMYCYAICDSVASLEQHVRAMHYRNMQFDKKQGKDVGKFILLCPLCSVFSAQLVEELRIHLAVVHKRCDAKFFQASSQKLRCVICNAKITGKAQLSRHIWRNHTSEKMYTCKWCKAVYFSAKALDEHEEVKHLGNIQCPLCADKFSSNSHLKAHYTQKHDQDMSSTPERDSMTDYRASP